MKEVLKLAAQLSEQQVSFVLVTMLSSRGHAPQDPGAKAIVSCEGLLSGTVGGGKVEAKAIEHAKNLLNHETQKAEPQVHTWNLQNDVGMTCGGEVTFLFETFHSKTWPLVIFGAGHISQALVRTLLPLPCQIKVVDTRPEWLERLPEDSRIQKILVEDSTLALQNCSEKDFFLVMTRGHATDMPVLKEIYARFPNAPYVGVIGSDVKAIKIRNELKSLSMSPSWIEKLHCPMGLDFGSNHPYEIALSIAAEVLKIRDEASKNV